jgi:hypothetical protein
MSENVSRSLGALNRRTSEEAPLFSSAALIRSLGFVAGNNCNLSLLSLLGSLEFISAFYLVACDGFVACPCWPPVRTHL